MKKKYTSPEVEIEQFIISAKSLITTSGIEDGDTEEIVDF